MKKSLCRVLSVLFLCLLAVPAVHADSIVLPDGDPFFDRYGDDCEYLQRTYTANGPDGYVSLYKSPLSTQVRENIANGENLYCSSLYTDADGVQWGGVWRSTWNENDPLRGWVRLSDCVVVPDYLSFAEAHESEFFPYDASYNQMLENAERLVLWTYPGSGTVSQENMDTGWLADGPESYISQCYEDSAGRVWGYINYLYGYRHVWLCLSDPANTGIPADPDVLPPQPELVPPADEIPSPGPSIPLLTVGLIAALAVLTAVFIRFFFGRQKKNAN